MGSLLGESIIIKYPEGIDVKNPNGKLDLT